LKPDFVDLCSFAPLNQSVTSHVIDDAERRAPAGRSRPTSARSYRTPAGLLFGIGIALGA
jgi:hypothetical protein